MKKCKKYRQFWGTKTWRRSIFIVIAVFVCLSVIAAYLITHHPERFALDLGGPQYIKVTGNIETSKFAVSKGQYTTLNVYFVAINQPHTGKKFWIKSGKPSANALLSALLYKMGEKTPVVLEGWVSKQKMITGRESMMGTEVTIPEGFVPCDGIMDVEEAVCYPVFIEICRDELAYQYRQITDCSWMEAEDFVIKLKRKAEKEFEARPEKSNTDKDIETLKDELEKDIKEFEAESREDQLE